MLGGDRDLPCEGHLAPLNPSNSCPRLLPQGRVKPAREELRFYGIYITPMAEGKAQRMAQVFARQGDENEEADKRHQGG